MTVRTSLIISFALLLCSCGGKQVEEYPPREKDTVGITVPEDAIPEHWKPGNADSTDSSR